MTLKENFGNLELDDPYIFMCESDAEKCVQIAYEFAIEFLKWVVSSETSDLLHDLEIVGEIDENITPEQLLEIYKKEKAL